MNNKGFAITGIMYTMLLLFVIILSGTLIMMGSRKSILDNLRNDTLAKIDDINRVAVNKPELTDGLRPVKWNGTTWVETTEVDSEWYNYSTNNKRWANAVSEDCVEDNDLATCSMWVWIPRFAYSITSGYHTSSLGGIDVKFLKNNTNVTYDNIPVDLIPTYSSDVQTNYIEHPAFKFGTEELTGFWMAKFEASPAEGMASTSSCLAGDNVTTKTVKVVPNVISWRCINTSNSFNVALDMKNDTNYGWSASSVDTHMMKNTEWGAVSYLSQSSYGRDDEIWINNNSDHKTGCAGNTQNSVATTECNTYNTELGQKASTTSNIYGVYDMGGGSWEQVMAVYNGIAGSSGFTAGQITGLDNKYIDRYTTAGGNLLNAVGMDYDATILGDAMNETSFGAARNNGTTWVGNYYSGWSGDYSFIPTINDSWINRGARQGLEGKDGLYAFRPVAGGAIIDLGFRPVLVVN